jgi:hypothetical protein
MRLWRDGEDESHFRGRITACLDIVEAGNEVVLVRNADEVEAYVSEWLQRLAGAGYMPRP